MRSLSARILLGFFALMVAFGTFVVTIVWNLREVEDQASLILQGYVPLTMALTDLAQREDDLRQHLDHPAIGDPPSGAMIDHAFQLPLQRKQARDAPFDRLKLGARDGIHFGAGLVWPV